MKKKLFIILSIIVVLLVFASLFTSYIDSARVRNSVEPKYTIKIVSRDGTRVTYWGLGYKVIRYPSVSPIEPYDMNRGVKYGSWFMDYEPATEISAKEAIRTAQVDIKGAERNTITNFDNPKVDEVVLDEKTSIYLFDSEYDIVGIKAYKITFNTTADGLLGPIVYYVDKENGKLIGTDYRE